MATVAQQRECANRNLHAFQPFQAAYKNEKPPGPVSDLPSGLGPVDGLKRREVDAGGNDKYSLGVGPIRRDELHALVRGRGDQEVGLLSDLALDANP